VFGPVLPAFGERGRDGLSAEPLVQCTGELNSGVRFCNLERFVFKGDKVKAIEVHFGDAPVEIATDRGAVKQVLLNAPRPSVFPPLF
jgi:hypothetical protein